jgi:hypothetical protein
MFKKQVLLKLLVSFVLLLSFSSVLMFGYSYWDSNHQTDSELLVVGDWGIPITTAHEFYLFATKTDSVSTDRYYLFNDIDFSGYNWDYDNTTSQVTFRGTLDGNGKTLRNLTLTYNSSYSYFGIFPRMDGGSVYNVTLENIDLRLGNTALGGTSTRSGLITGNAYGSTNTISNITIIDSGVRGTSSSGVGGLVGNVSNSSTVVNIDNIKATNLKVFSKNSSVGGLVGYISSSSATVNVSDIDIQGEVYSYASSSYTGGLIGRIRSGALFYADRAIVDMTSQNTLETNYTYYLKYSNRYLGGFIGYNQSTSNYVGLNNVFFTGSLYTDTSANRSYVGTAIGRSGGSQSLHNDYYARVEFRSLWSQVIYSPDTTLRGINAQLVSEQTLPSGAWWDSFATEFMAANDLWTQDGTGRLTLIR